MRSADLHYLANAMEKIFEEGPHAEVPRYESQVESSPRRYDLLCRESVDAGLEARRADVRAAEAAFRLPLHGWILQAFAALGEGDVLSLLARSAGSQEG